MSLTDRSHHLRASSLSKHAGSHDTSSIDDLITSTELEHKFNEIMLETGNDAQHELTNDTGSEITDVFTDEPPTGMNGVHSAAPAAVPTAANTSFVPSCINTVHITAQPTEQPYSQATAPPAFYFQPSYPLQSPAAPSAMPHLEPSTAYKLQPFQSPAVGNYTIHHSMTPATAPKQLQTQYQPPLTAYSHTAMLHPSAAAVTAVASAVAPYAHTPAYQALPLTLQAELEHEVSVYEHELLAKQQTTLQEFVAEFERFRLQYSTEHSALQTDQLTLLNTEFQQEKQRLTDKLESNRMTRIQAYGHELVQKYTQRYGLMHGMNGHVTSTPAPGSATKLAHDFPASSQKPAAGDAQPANTGTTHSASKKADKQSQPPAPIDIAQVQRILASFETTVIDIERKSRQLRHQLLTLQQFVQQHTTCQPESAANEKRAVSQKSARKVLRPSTAHQATSNSNSNKGTADKPRRASLSATPSAVPLRTQQQRTSLRLSASAAQLRTPASVRKQQPLHQTPKTAERPPAAQPQPTRQPTAATNGLSHKVSTADLIATAEAQIAALREAEQNERPATATARSKPSTGNANVRAASRPRAKQPAQSSNRKSLPQQKPKPAADIDSYRQLLQQTDRALDRQLQEVQQAIDHDHSSIADRGMQVVEKLLQQYKETGSAPSNGNNRWQQQQQRRSDSDQKLKSVLSRLSSRQ